MNSSAGSRSGRTEPEEERRLERQQKEAPYAGPGAAPTTAAPGGVVNEITFKKEDMAKGRRDPKGSARQSLEADSKASNPDDLRSDVNKIREQGGFSPVKPIVSPPKPDPGKPKAKGINNFVNMPKMPAIHQAPTGSKLLPSSPRVSRVAAANAARGRREGLNKAELMRAINRDNKRLFADRDVEL